MWELEKDFGESIKTKLKFQKLRCIRIETGTTSVGIPDMFVEGKGDDYFIELKNVKQTFDKKDNIKIPWRAGQQAFAASYMSTHSKSCLYYNININKCSWTFIGMKDGIICVRMNSFYPNNCIDLHKAGVFVFDRSTWSTLSVSDFLKAQTYVISLSHMLKEYETLGQLIFRTVQVYTEDIFKQSVDYDHKVILEDAVYRMSEELRYLSVYKDTMSKLDIDTKLTLFTEDSTGHNMNCLLVLLDYIREIAYEYAAQQQAFNKERMQIEKDWNNEKNKNK